MCFGASSHQLAQQGRSTQGLAPAQGLALGSSPHAAATHHAEASRALVEREGPLEKEGASSTCLSAVLNWGLSLTQFIQCCTDFSQAGVSKATTCAHQVTAGLGSSKMLNLDLNDSKSVSECRPIDWHLVLPPRKWSTFLPFNKVLHLNRYSKCIKPWKVNE